MLYKSFGIWVRSFLNGNFQSRIYWKIDFFRFPLPQLTLSDYVINDFCTLIILPFLPLITVQLLKKKIFNKIPSKKIVTISVLQSCFLMKIDRSREECCSLDHCHLLQCIFLLQAVSEQLLKLVLVCMSVFLCVLHHDILKHHQGRTLHPLACVSVPAIILIDLQRPVCLYS